MEKKDQNEWKGNIVDQKLTYKISEVLLAKGKQKLVNVEVFRKANLNEIFWFLKLAYIVNLELSYKLL